MKIKNILVIGVLATCHLALSSQAAFANDVLLYQFQKKMNTVEQAQKMMHQFLPGESYQKLEVKDGNVTRYVSPKDVNTTFEFDYDTGNMRFKRNFSRYLGDFEPKLPSSNNAVEIAQEFLQKNGLQPKDKSQLRLAHIGGLRASSMIDGKSSGPVIDKLVTLSYSRQVNGLPVIGPGSKFIIHIGDGGEIVGLTKHWRMLEKEAVLLSSKMILNEVEAFSQAKKTIATEFGKNASFELTDHQLAYYDNNGQYLQPVYVFQVKVKPTEYSEPFDYSCVIEAMKKPKEALNLRVVDKKALLALEKSNALDVPIANEKSD